MTDGRRIALPDAKATRDLGRGIGENLRGGDLVVLIGDLGAGKTTLTQGIGIALGVRGPITSPTFVIARTHPSLIGGADLVHVDAYRLGGGADVDDLDLGDADAVTVVEWGAGLVEHLAESHLTVELITLESAEADGHGEDMRIATLRGHGERWTDADITRIAEASEGRA